jgi:hypothetical protein
MPDSSGAWRDEDFCPPAPPADPVLAVLADRIRTHLRAGGPYLEMVEEVRLFIMARFYQVSPDSITDELAQWGMEPGYAAELVVSALATSRYDKRAEMARRMAAADDAGRPVDPALAAMGQPAPPGPVADSADTGYPDRCPGCDRVLFPVARLRPAPSLGWPARLLLLAGCVLTAATYWAGLVGVRMVVGVPVWTLSLLWFPVALLPALGCGILAYRFPRVARLGCRGCGWRSQVVLRRRG